MPIFGLKCQFWAIFGRFWAQNRGATTLNFGPISTKLGGTVRAIWKITQKDNGPGPGRNYGETAVFMFGRKVVFWPKILFFNKKKKPKFAISEEGTFLFALFFLVVARTWLEQRSGLFFGRKNSVFGPKIRFLPYNPKFCQRPVCSPRKDGPFRILGLIFWHFVSELQSFL